MTSTIKVNNIQNQCGANIINENSNTITLGASGDTIALASGASQTGFGRTGTVDWETTPKTGTFTAVSGKGYFANTTASAFTMNLPAGSAGDIVSVMDYAGTWQTYNLTIAANGTEKIGGVASAPVALSTQGQSVTFVYVDSTQGWLNTMDSTSNVKGNAYMVATGGTITTSGNDKIHTFTGPGTFTVCTTAVCAANNLVSYMVVAGGGGGGTHRAGGGGAGGFRELKSPATPYTASPLDGYPSAPNRVTVTATGYPITVGSGGSGGPGSASPTPGGTGNTSVFSTITSAGGGGGGGGDNPGVNGGSGGGGGGNGSLSGGTGNTPPVTPAQGTNGGTGAAGPPNYGSGGGAGATDAGSNGTPTAGGDGGDGATTNISGSPTAYAGGGGGSHYCSSGPSAGSGGTGGGGNAAFSSPLTPSVAGTANTGGGGGGGQHKGVPSPAISEQGAAGGSGVVIIRYKYQ